MRGGGTEAVKGTRLEETLGDCWAVTKPPAVRRGGGWGFSPLLPTDWGLLLWEPEASLWAGPRGTVKVPGPHPLPWP